MAYVYICEACKEGRHTDCEKNRDIPPKAADPWNQVFGGGICVCPHDDIYLTPDDVWKKQREV